MNICSIGEILWDCFPGQELLGGAPLNFATNIHRLGGVSLLVSAIGKDRRGERALRSMRKVGLNTEYVRILSGIHTGMATVDVGPNGEPIFKISRPAAFDRILLSEQMINSINNYKIDWLYFGTLAQMSPQVEQSTRRLCTSLQGARVFYDMNLRNRHWNIELVRRLSRMANVLKLNESEAKLMFDLSGNAEATFSLEAFCSKWATEYELDAICVTLGESGCGVYEGGILTTCASFPVQVVDTVGAGDAFAAGFLYGHHHGWSTDKAASFANAAGAVVASHAGATPPITLEECAGIAFAV